MLLNAVLFFPILCTTCLGKGTYFRSNASRTTIPGIAEYRSALTLDWLTAEDLRQKEIAIAFQTESAPPVQMLASECVSYEKPAPGKVARLMLELLKNLEGDDGQIIPELIQALIRSKLLIETSVLEEEPDLDSLVKTPGVMMGAPHATFPRILALVWMSATDPTSTKKTGWCTLNKITKYLSTTRPAYIASHMRNLDQVVARARYIMEEFIQHVTPNMYERSEFIEKQTSKQPVLAALAKKLQSRPVYAYTPPALRFQSLSRLTLNPNSYDMMPSDIMDNNEENTPQISRDRDTHASLTGMANVKVSVLSFLMVNVFVVNFLV